MFQCTVFACSIIGSVERRENHYLELCREISNDEKSHILSQFPIVSSFDVHLLFDFTKARKGVFFVGAGPVNYDNQYKKGLQSFDSFYRSGGQNPVSAS